MKRTFSQHDYLIVRKVFLEISHSEWFEPAEQNSLATYLLHEYQNGHDETSLKARSVLFAREWFRMRDQSGWVCD